ncbi:cyclic nucleotide-binding domain-containing protein [Adhaeretor mobilis]|nr:cyclic nucleotide-binding domain-containing protein [Adhaeretor mobilis]
MHWSLYGFHFGNILYLVAYLVRDILWLRIVTIAAIAAMLPYYYCCHSSPQYQPIAWCSLFVAVNLVQIGLLIWERRPVFVGERELQIYREVFNSLSAREFVKLLSVADWKQVASEAKLLSQNESVDALMLIARGTGGVQIDGRHVADIRVNQFLGEMAFLTGAPASADVIAQTELQVLSWPLDKLRDFLVEYPQIHFKLRGVLGTDLVEKLRQRGHADAHPSLM